MTDAAHHNLFEGACLAALGRALRRVGGVGITPEQCHRDCRPDQRRPCDSHDLPTPNVVVSRSPPTPYSRSRAIIAIDEWLAARHSWRWDHLDANIIPLLLECHFSRDQSDIR